MLRTIRQRAVNGVLLTCGFEHDAGPPVVAGRNSRPAASIGETSRDIGSQLWRDNRRALRPEKADDFHRRWHRNNKLIVDGNDHTRDAGITAADFERPAHGLVDALLVDVKDEAAQGADRQRLRTHNSADSFCPPVPCRSLASAEYRC